jgi:S-(hydroxymethyl)glutathione dehydrogenase/alcohol dehydrogenase
MRRRSWTAPHQPMVTTEREIRTRAVILEKPGAVPTVEPVTVLPPGNNEVRVRMAASGICHTDLAYMRDAENCPVVLGHEGAGVVESVGVGVTRLRAGDRIVVNWLPKCGKCRRCLSGRAEFCEQSPGTSGPRVFHNGRPVNVMLRAGTFCPYVVVAEHGAVRITPHLDLADAALLGCAVATGIGAALYCARIEPGEAVAVLGAGGIGLNVVQGARLANAGAIIAVDIDDDRLEIARKLGATHIVNAQATSAVDRVMEVTLKRGVEHVVEAVGSPDLMLQGIDMLARGGILTLVGAAARPDTLPFHPRRFMSRQQSIRGCIYGNIRPDVDLPLFAEWCCSGKLTVRALRSAMVKLDDVPGLFNASSRRTGIRTLVAFQGQA